MGSVWFFLGYLFTFWVPGFILIEQFVPQWPKTLKLPSYLILSVLVSTHVLYLLSYVWGFSFNLIIVVMGVSLPWFIFRLQRFKGSLIDKHHLGALLISLGIALVFAIAVYPGIFTKHQGYWVMSGVNWQDTANHMGIIESFTQGNFPPQASYYSGVPLAYYHYTDFHTAILVKLFGNFFPKVLVWDNSMFVFIFALCLYALGYHVFHSVKRGILSVVFGTLSGNLMWVRFLQDLKNNSVINLLTNTSYHHEYQKIMQVTPISDYLLQNRPMMMGLPGMALGGILVLLAFREKNDKKLIFAIIIAGLLVQFQPFAAASVCFLAFLCGFYYKNIKYSFLFILFTSIFFIPTIFSSVNGHSAAQSLLQSFEFGPWDKTKSLWWYIIFYVANFPLLLVAIFGIKRQRVIFEWALGLWLIPNLIRFTVFGWDMFKFYYFMVIPVSVLAATALKNKIITFVAVFITCFTSILILANCFLNKNEAYTQSDYEVGLWIRNHTPQRSVFLSMPTVHDPATQIGGRLRVLSYINWPYSHGYNTGSDNVFARLDDIKLVYSQMDSKFVLYKYKVRYVYSGPEELANFPKHREILDQATNLRVVYNSGGIQIYEVF